MRVLLQQLEGAALVKADLREPGVQDRGTRTAQLPSICFLAPCPGAAEDERTQRVVHASPTALAESITPDQSPGLILYSVILLRSFAVPWSPLAGGRQGVLPTWGLWAGSSVPLSHAWSPMLAQKRLETPFGFKDQHAGQARALLWQQPPEVLAHQPGEGCSALGVVKAAQVPRSRMQSRRAH